jgi:Thioredoxin like C-terminal domain
VGRLTTGRGPLSALDGATEWLGPEPLTAAGLAGSVVAVQFCTYSCINWIRTLPYVRAWDDAYRDAGLVVVGAHAPEFTFERELVGVRRALEAMGVHYPVVLDNEYAIWQAFGNHYWPALYLFDGDGRLRYEHFGEGAYVETEDAIRQLLAVDGERVQVEPAGVELPGDPQTLRSPETYVGYLRGEARSEHPDELALNQWALTRRWGIEPEFAELQESGGSIRFRFEARDLNLVLTPPAGVQPGFTVLLDGRPPGDAHGLDVDEAGRGAVGEPRLYQLVRQAEDVHQRTFEITFDDPGVRAYVFTFG